MTFYLYLSRLKKEITKKRIFDAFLVSVRRKLVLIGLGVTRRFFCIINQLFSHLLGWHAQGRRTFGSSVILILVAAQCY